MTVYVRNTETGGVVGVSEDVADDLCRSEASTFERVDRTPEKAPAKKTTSRASSTKK